MSIWDVELDKLQDSRLLALRMHVARYVVRVGARQRSVVVVLGQEDEGYGKTLLELLEAAGALAPSVVSIGTQVPDADIVMIARHRAAGSGDAALPLDPLAKLAGLRPGQQGTVSPEPPAVQSRQVWAIDVEALAGAVDTRIVESVEALIRMVMPEALGANGTPPDEAVAVRLV